MVNEKKVKLMTRMAMYEAKQGKEDLKISSYYKKDYTSLQTIITILWVTVGYILAVGIGLFINMDKILNHLDLSFIAMLLICLATGWLVLVLIYGIIASTFYGKKHGDARKRVKKLNHDLTRLSHSYERKKK